MSTVIGILVAIASIFANPDRLGTDCQQGRINGFEDGSYTVESSDNAIVCEIDSHPESSLSYMTATYDNKTGIVTVTRVNLTVGETPVITVLYTGR